MKYLGTHHDTGVKLPTVGNAIWLSFYVGQYDGDFDSFIEKTPADAGKIQKDIYIDKRTYVEQLVDSVNVDLIVLCVRCLQGEINHFMDCFEEFSQQLCEHVYNLGYENVKVELLSEPIEIVKPHIYRGMLIDLRKALDYYRGNYNLQLLAGAGDLHHKQHQDYYKYLRDNAFHEFDCWSIHCINDPMKELVWAHANLGDKPIHITEYTELDYILAHGPNASWTLNVLDRFLRHASYLPNIKSLFQVFPARIEGKYELWSVHNSKYLTTLKEFYNKYIKEETVNDLDIKIYYRQRSLAVRFLQLMLLYNGYDPKYIDGKFGDLTLKALNAFQKEWKIGVKDYCDLDDMISLANISARGLICLIAIINLKTK